MADEGDGFKIGDAFVEVTAQDNTAAGREKIKRSVSNIRGQAKIDADVKAAETAIKQTRAKLAELEAKRTSPKIDADIAAAEAQLAKVNARLNDLRSKKTSPKIELDIAAAEARARQIQTRIDALGSKRSSPKIDADISAANAKIAQLEARIAALRDKRVNVNTNTTGASSSMVRLANQIRQTEGSAQRLSLALGAIPTPSSGAIGVLMGIAAAAGAAGAAVAVLPGLLAGLGSIGGVLAGSFSGVGDALKGYKADQDAAASSAGAGASAARSNARAIRDATQAINDAKENQARVARQTAEQVADAEERVEVATEQAARTARDSARAVEQAQRGLADAQKDAARTAQQGADSIAAASRRVQDAQRAETAAQNDLNKARADAARQLVDLAFAAEDAALAQQGAALGLEQAQARLAQTNDDALSTDLDKRQALYDVAVAQQRVKESAVDATRATEDNNSAQAKGVDGLDSVVSAQERVQDAARSTADAQADLAKAQADAAQANIDAQQRVADAVTAVSDAQTAAAEANADAQRAVADAQKDLARAQQDAADQQADAAKRVADAQQQLADAQEDANQAMGGGAGAASKFAQAMAKLNPAQREFVKQLIAMKPLVKGLSDTASAAFLPGLTQMLKDSEGLFPIFNRSLSETGTIMGNTARQMGELFKSSTFQNNLTTLLASTRPVTEAVGNLLVGMVDKIVEFGAKSAPVMYAFAGFLNDVKAGLDGFFDALSTPQATKDFASIWTSLGQIMRDLLPIIGELVAWLANHLAPVLADFAAWFHDNKDAIGDLAPVLLGVVGAIKGLQIAVNINKWFQGVSGVFDALKTAAGGSKSKVDDAATAVGDLIDGKKGGKSGGKGAVKAIDEIGDAATKNTPKVDGLLGKLSSMFGTSSKLGLLGAAGGAALGGAALAAEPYLLQKYVGPAGADLAIRLNLGAAQADLQGLMQQVNSSVGTINVNGKTLNATEALGSVLAAVDRGEGSVTINGKTVPSKQALADIIAQINSGAGEVTIGGKTMPAGDALQMLLMQVGTSSASITIDGNVNPATGKLQGTIDFGNGAISTMTLDSNVDPATGKIHGTLDLGNGSTATVTIDANPDPATGKVNATIDFGNGQTTTVQLDANQAKGLDKVNGFIGWGNTQTTTTHVDAETSKAQSAFDAFKATVVRGMSTVITAVFGNAAGNIVAPMANGGVLGFASGGTARKGLTPMSGSSAALVPPNTWRVIGDNMRHTELFAPLNGSKRSLNLIKYGAAQFGYDLTPQIAAGRPTLNTAIPSLPGASRQPAPASTASTGPGGTVHHHYNTISLNVQGLLDFRGGDVATRKMVEDLRQALIKVERSYA